MERTLEELEKVIGYFDAAKTEEKFILSTLNNSENLFEVLPTFFEALDRLRFAFSYLVNMKVKNSDSLKAEQKSLIFKATSKLEFLFRNLLSVIF